MDYKSTNNSDHQIRIKDEYCLEVKGDYACFTRPDLKVERMSYPVMTPSAARAIFEAVLMKPYAMRWEVTRIEVLTPVKYADFRRNEVAAVGNLSCPDKPIIIEKCRTQRASRMLRDAMYRIYARLIYIPIDKRPVEQAFSKHVPTSGEDEYKYHNMFQRRAKMGVQFHQPYLGTRECTAMWRYVNNPAAERVRPIDWTEDLGLMFYDWDFGGTERQMWFHARIKNGVMDIPARDSEEVLK